MTIFRKISEYRTPLMGVAMICVFLFHSMGHWMPTCIYNVVKKGDVGVDVFLFLSAIGLTYSISKNPSVIAFYERRVLRIMPTYWFVMTAVYLFVYVMTAAHIMPDDYYPIPRSLWQIVQAYTTLGYWVKNGIYYLWYIPAILLLYLVFPLVHRLFASCRWMYIMVLVPGAVIAFCHPDIAWYHNCLLYRVGIFFWGGIFAIEFLQRGRNVNRWGVYAVGVLSFLFYIVRQEMGGSSFNRMTEEILFFIALPCILVCVTESFRVRCLKTFASFVGKLSLEFYLIHEFVMRFMETISNVIITMSPLVQKIATFIVALGLAYLTKLIVSKMIALFSTKKI